MDDELHEIVGVIVKCHDEHEFIYNEIMVGYDAGMEINIVDDDDDELDDRDVIGEIILKVSNENDDFHDWFIHQVDVMNIILVDDFQHDDVYVIETFVIGIEICVDDDEMGVDIVERV